MESVFNPKVEGPMNIITEDANPNYLESRAMEFIREARQCLGTNPEQPTDMQLQQYNDRLIKAIALLGLAKLTRRRTN